MPLAQGSVTSGMPFDMALADETTTQPTCAGDQPLAGRAAEPPAASGNRWQCFLAAVQFLTRVPLPQSWLRPVSGSGGADLGQAAVYFPLVGALIGLATGGVIWLAAHVWPLGVAVLVGLALEALLTGSLHEDALADFCDAFGGGWTRDEVLRILDDSRVGSYGVLGLLLGVLLRYSALAAMPAGEIVAATVAAAVLGRWSMLWAMAMLPPVAGRRSLAHAAGQQLGRWQVARSGLIALPALAPLVWIAPAVALASTLGVVLLAGGLVYYVRRRIGGMTGDCLGALCYAAQVLVLLICVAWRSV